MVAYQYRLPSGTPGAVSRDTPKAIEPGQYNASLPFPSYGVAVTKTANGFVPVVSSTTQQQVAGFLVRPFPTSSSSNALGTAVPPTTGIADSLRQGYMTVRLYGTAAAVAGAFAYVRIAGGTAPTNLVGGVEAAADATPANTLLMDGNVGVKVTFTGAADPAGNVEIAINI